jgi:hypothetical protein
LDQLEERISERETMLGRRASRWPASRLRILRNFLQQM